MPASPEIHLIQLTMTREEFSILNAMVAGLFDEDPEISRMAGAVIQARRHAAASFIKKVNALAYTELPEKVKELADLRRTHDAS